MAPTLEIANNNSARTAESASKLYNSPLLHKVKAVGRRFGLILCRFNEQFADSAAIRALNQTLMDSFGRVRPWHGLCDF
jgi:hypothetical protein